MKKSLLFFLVLIATLLISSCASTSNQPKAVVEGEIKIVGEEPGLGISIVVPIKEEVVVDTPSVEETLPVEETTREEDEKTEETTERATAVLEEIIPEAAEEETIASLSTEKEDDEPFSSPDKDDMLSLFNYAYGLKTMDDIRSENISLDARYYARAVVDASKGAVPTLIGANEIQSTIDKFVREYYINGKTFEAGTRPLGMEDLNALPSPSSLTEAFSYAYTFSIVRELIDGEVDIVPEPFLLGGLDSLTGSERLLDEKETEEAISAYLSHVNEEYAKEIAAKGQDNSNKAASFLEKNRMRDEVTVLSDGIQIEILGEDETLGDHPTQYDTVLLDYNIYVLDYETEELEIIDADYSAKLRLMEIDSAMRSAIVALRVGQAGRAWVPPENLYGDRNIEGIEPNSIVVYDIALNQIL